MKYLITSLESFQKGEVPEEIQEFLKVNPQPFIILDESSKIKSNRASIQKKKSKRCQGIQKLNETGHRCILTGTFMSKSPVNAYDQMEFLCKDYFQENMFSFERRYVILVRLPIGRGIVTIIPEDIYRSIHRGLKKYKDDSRRLFELMDSYEARFGINQKKLRWILANEEYSPFMDVDEVIRRVSPYCLIAKKKDVLDLPEKVYSTIKVPPSKEMLELYKSLLQNGFTEDFVSKGNGISMYHRFQDIVNGYIPVSDEDGNVSLQRQKENLKLETLKEKLEELDLAQTQVVIWSNRKMLINDIQSTLLEEGYDCAIFDGDVKDADREEIKELFQSGKIRILIANQRSGAYGMDWLKTAEYAFFISNDYSVEVREQAEDRIHRGGIVGSRFIYDIVIDGTVDEKVQRALLLGKELIHSGQTDREVFELDKEVVW